jgi:hypothetical protein
MPIMERMYRLPEIVQGAVTRLAVRRRRADEFSCADCDRWRRCGLPPDGNCLARAEVLARSGGRVPRRTALRDWAAWGY